MQVQLCLFLREFPHVLEGLHEVVPDIIVGGLPLIELLIEVLKHCVEFKEGLLLPELVLVLIEFTYLGICRGHCDFVHGVREHVKQEGLVGPWVVHHYRYVYASIHDKEQGSVDGGYFFGGVLAQVSEFAKDLVAHALASLYDWPKLAVFHEAEQTGSDFAEFLLDFVIGNTGLVQVLEGRAAKSEEARLQDDVSCVLFVDFVEFRDRFLFY